MLGWTWGMINMPKRRRTLALDESRDDAETAKKRKRIQLDPGEICQELYDIIRNYKADDGHLLCETFIRAPKRRSFADYYEVVATPMDLLKIQQKLKTEEYTEVEQMTSDIELMINNAKAYYKRNSQEYKDACELWELYVDTKNDFMSATLSDGKRDDDAKMLEGIRGEEDNPSDCGEEDTVYEELFTAVMTATDTDGRSLGTMFQLLPSKVRYPEYYKVISEPVDLKMIATKIQNNSYQALAEMERDLLVMVKNAKLFNEPGSQIYKDAAQLRKVIVNKKAEIDQRKSLPSKSSERIRARKLAGGQKWSAITAALQYETDPEIPLIHNISTVTRPLSGIEPSEEPGDGDDGNGSGPEDADTNPQWQLFETVKNYQTVQGYQLSEPFLRLPSKRFYPDYYREIKQPISLNKIRTKIMTNQYNSTMEVVDDMNLMFENARKYNRPDSKLFKDAVRLQKIMQAKARELINLHMKDSDSDDEERTSKRKAKKLALAMPMIEVKRPRKSLESELTAKKRMKILYKTLLDYVDEMGRPLITMFMEKPSKKDYPDYYEIIPSPIDMKTIEINIKADKYSSEESLINDFKIMFNNCRQYNEEGSQIYRDAETLERVLIDRVREYNPAFDPNKGKGFLKKTVKDLAREELPRGNFYTGVKHKLRTLYETLRDYTDNKGRKLSLIFMKLPSKTDYPDYYEVIKRPIDMEKIGSRMKSGQYETLEDILSDFVLMFDNACKYNEPDSQIYKDALTLQRIALQTKLELSEDTQNGIPDVRALVQELLTSLFISVYNHQDEEGRCYSDSLAEFSETDTSPDPTKRLLNLDMIKRNLDRNRYRRLDKFQQDMFEVFEHARHVSRTDSQVFEDCVELQSFFIKMRDRLCKNGEVLSSPALRYTEADLQASVETLKAEKLPREQQEADLEPKHEKEERSNTEMSTSDSVVFRGQTYYVGDFVYIEPREKGMEPHIIHIERLWRDNQGEQWIYGCWFYRPNETFHLATRKFLQMEVFKSDNYNSTPLNQVLGRCYVMFVKDYFKYKPEGFEDKDVYICESRYSAKAKAFKKIKIWGCTPNDHVCIVPREEPLVPVRVPSVFKDGVERPKDDSSDYDDSDPNVTNKPRPNVICDLPNPEDGRIFYEQFTIPSGTYKLGDCCYVRTEHGKTLIGRIDKMWVNRDGRALFHGPWFVTPQEVQHPPTRLFFKQEVFLSSIEDTNPLLSIIAHCAVLDYKDYITKRITEIPEQDVYICESRYMEAEKQIRRLPKGLKKFNLKPAVTENEYYYFRKSINPQKELSPLMPKVNSETENEESNDLPPPPVTPKEEPGTNTTPSTSSKKKSVKRLVTGYILFASEVRRSVIAENPDRSFGEISRLIGTEWRNLPTIQKSEYEDRAQKQNEETAAREGTDSMPQSPASGHGNSGGNSDNKGENIIYECMWEGCDFQFEDQQDLMNHIVMEPHGHVQQTYQNSKEGEYQCLWHNCSRVKKNVPPFPNIQRLIRHCKEVHLKASSKSVPPENRNKNFVPSRRPIGSPGSSAGNTTSGGSGGGGGNSGGGGSNQSGSYSSHPPTSSLHPGMLYTSRLSQSHQAGMYTSSYLAQDHGMTYSRQLDPLFVSTPPRSQKLLHSSTYIRYIEGLQPDSKHLSNWDSQLKATKENTPLNESVRLPVHWLGNGAGNHGNVVNALWALRNFMLRDALNISKIL